MEPFTSITGPAAPLLQANIDTDVIIRIERLMSEDDRSHLADFALEALRFLPDGREDPDFVLNREPFRQAPILLAGPNFGCGSSREGAVTALLARGIRAIVAPSFGDIFYGNCFQNGVLPIRVDERLIEAMAARSAEGMTTVDLAALTIASPGGAVVPFHIDAQRREALLTGLDDLGRTLLLREEIREWQTIDRERRPWVWTAGGQPEGA